MSSAEEFAQLRLKFTDPIQHEYEVIRPIVLFSETITERSRQTGVERTWVGEKAHRFVQQGMLGLVDQRIEHSGGLVHDYPEAVAAHMLYLKQLYPPIHYREIVRIIERKFGYQTNHHTVKNFLHRHALPVQLELDFTHFHDFEDAYRARWTVVRMYYQGWNKKSIAGCLRLSRKHVHEIMAAFERDGFAGLEDQRTRPANHPENQWAGVAYFASSDWIEDLTPYLEKTPGKFHYEDFSESVQAATSWPYGGVPKIPEGRPYSMMQELTTRIFIYRDDLFNDPNEQEAFQAKYGRELTVPKTTDELLEVAEFFTRPDENLYGISFEGARDLHIYAVWVHFLWAFVGQEWDPATYDITLDSPEAIAATDYILKLSQFTPPGRASRFMASAKSPRRDLLKTSPLAWPLK